MPAQHDHSFPGSPPCTSPVAGTTTIGHPGRQEYWFPQDDALDSAPIFSSILSMVLSRLDLLVSSDMLLQPPDRKLPLNCPTRCHQADRQDSGTSEKVKVHVPVGAGVGFVEEIDPGQEECWGKENAEGGVLSHGCLAKGRVRYSERSLTFVNTPILELLSQAIMD